MKIYCLPAGLSGTAGLAKKLGRSNSGEILVLTPAEWKAMLQMKELEIEFIPRRKRANERAGSDG